MALIKDMGEKFTSTYGTMTKAQFDSLKKAEKEKEKKTTKEATPKYCALKRNRCNKNCALWNGTECRIQGGGQLQVAGRCPLSNEHCGTDCSFFKENNCVLF